MIQEVWLGDCLELMQKIPDKSVDMILCDLPYGTTQNKWDVVIQFESLWSSYERIIKENGPIVLFGAQPFTSLLVCSKLDWFKYDWCWKKPKGTGHLNVKKQPMRDKEDICVFCKSSPVYYPQMIQGEPYKGKPGKSKPNNRQDCYGDYLDIREDNLGYRYPKTIIEYGIVERDKLHPTQKPIPLLEFLIKTYTQDGDLILDNCAGSGSTLVAAKNLNRQFVGIEKEENYYNICLERLK